MVFIMALLALSIDVGMIALANTEIKRSTDAAALAGAGVLIEGTDAANRQAFELLARNPVGNFDMTEGEDGWEDNLATLMEAHADEFETEVGHWNSTNADLRGLRGLALHDPRGFRAAQYAIVLCGNIRHQ